MMMSHSNLAFLNAAWWGQLGFFSEMTWVHCYIMSCACVVFDKCQCCPPPDWVEEGQVKVVGLPSKPWVMRHVLLCIILFVSDDGY